MKVAVVIPAGGKPKGKVADALAMSKEDDDEESEDGEVSDLAIEAMDAFTKAKSPADKAKAMRAFIKACGGY